MIVINKLGGVSDDDGKSLERAKESDLITLPKNVTGTNCYNCKFIGDKDENAGYCKHPKVKQYVNERMCCIRWSHSGEYRAFEGREEPFK
jgi:hypothetical protein